MRTLTWPGLPHLDNSMMGQQVPYQPSSLDSCFLVCFLGYCLCLSYGLIILTCTHSPTCTLALLFPAPFLLGCRSYLAGFSLEMSFLTLLSKDPRLLCLLTAPIFLHFSFLFCSIMFIISHLLITCWFS